MFDDPRKDLQRLQEQLLAAEEEPEEEPEEIPEEPEGSEEPVRDDAASGDGPAAGVRKFGWILAVLLLELGAALALLAWWLQWR